MAPAQTHGTHPHKLESRHYGNVGIPRPPFNPEELATQGPPTKRRYRKNHKYKSKKPSQPLLLSWKTKHQLRQPHTDSNPSTTSIDNTPEPPPSRRADNLRPPPEPPPPMTTHQEFRHNSQAPAIPPTERPPPEPPPDPDTTEAEHAQEQDRPLSPTELRQHSFGDECPDEKPDQHCRIFLVNLLGSPA